MPDCREVFENSVFTYYITDYQPAQMPIPKKAQVGKWEIYASDKTDVKISETDNGEAVIIIGFCVDSGLELAKDDICSYLLSHSGEDFSNAISRLAGKFVIARLSNEGIVVYTDATASLPVFHSQKDGFSHISSLEYFIKENTKSKLSKEALQIIKKSDNAKTLPATLAHYEDIFSLLPGHYYSSLKNKSVRYGKKGILSSLSPREAADITAPLILSIAKQITKDYEIKCPLTGGYDSRVVLAALKKISYGDPGIYTMRHNMPESNSDIAIPRMIAKDKGYKYTLIDDKKASLEDKSMCDSVMGQGLYSQRTLDIVITLKEHIGNACLLNGDIMGQIGKSSLHRSIKECFMGPRYYQCKVHNTSKHSLRELKKWYNSAKEYGISNICDKFSKEIRLGRWAADENSLYSLFGINVINIFNCTDIIDIWERVPRCYRKVSLLHMELLKNLNEDLVKYDFGASKTSLKKLAKKSDVSFYIATFVKFYIQALKNTIRK